MNKGSNQWKEHLLKSSLPLEQIVAEKVSSKGFLIGGEFAYLRNNEQDNSVEFSVDLRASKSTQVREDIEIWSTLELLIECKYASPNVDWVFATYPKIEPLTVNCIHNYDLLSSFWGIGMSLLVEIEKDAKYAVNGLALADKFFDNKRIKHGLSQLRFAIPSFLEKIASEDLLSSSDEENPIRLVAPMLVTNAPLRLLRDNVSFEDIRNANSLDDISDIHSVLYHYQQTGPELVRTVKKISEYIQGNLDDGKRNIQFSSAYINSELNSSLETIAVVHLDYLDEYIDKLKKAAASIKAVTQSELALLFKEADDPLYSIHNDT